jgi:PAS domain S-box-containing protein
VGRPLKILILGESSEAARKIERKLALNGYTIESLQADNAQDLTRALKQRGWEVIIADYSLKKISALEALELIRNTGKEIPFIILSSQQGEEAAVEAMKAGASDYIIKDRLGRLVPAIERSLREAIVRKERRRVEHALRENERRLSTLMSNLPGMAYRCRIDDKWTLKFVSEGCLELCGYPPSRLEGKEGLSFSDLIHPDDREKVACKIQAALEWKQPFQMTYRIRTASGDEKWVWEQGVGVFSDIRGLVALEGFITDISDRKRAEDALRSTLSELAASRADLEQFAYAASHDLRAPLRAIDNLTQWIEEDLDSHLKGETRRNMELLKRRVRRMERMIDGILDYARADILGIELEEVDVEELLKEIVDLLDPPAGFKISIPEGMPIIETAKAPLQQVFSNLIHNAIKHHDKERGRIEIAMEEGEDHYCFMVRDDGPGIPETLHEKVFMMFRTLKSRDEVEGTGIGLALVKKIVERAGGSLSLDSSPGEGSTFLVRWPKVWMEAKEESLHPLVQTF